MGQDKVVLGLVGSPNRNGRTNELVRAALAGAAKAGATTELVQMSDYVVDACKDCLPWVCATNLKCTYEDKAFEALSEKILSSGGLVLGTPVYWGDTSAMVRYLFIKMCRVFARAGQLKGLPALGIAIAGGSGNGLATGLRPVYHFFRVMQMRPLEPLPSTRFDFSRATAKAEAMGEQIGKMANARAPFDSSEECWLAYDRLPYIGEHRAEERMLLAAITWEATPDGTRKDLEGELSQAEILAASGRDLDALLEITRVYNSSVKAIDEQAQG